MDVIVSELQKLASVANGFTAIAFIIASWALRKFVADVQSLTASVRELELSVSTDLAVHHSRLQSLERQRGVEVMSEPITRVRRPGKGK